MDNTPHQEAKAPWHKASYSQGASNCVEVAEGAETFVRDTQNREAGHLALPGGEWVALLRVSGS